MTFKVFLTIFTTVLLAELGDKTQLATLLFATAAEKSKITIFLAAALTLVVASGIAVLLGNFLSKFVNPKYLSWVAGIGFITIDLWTIFRA
ncbi:MAG: TMEM165/GDT1 family protein [Candidatus Omnitrophota bacterium]|nr:TMEM165/GDT1 family protein [Candidatus Omnitrophota bacterium]